MIGSADEGMKKIAFSLYKRLSLHHDVLHLSLKNAFAPSFWKAARNFQPQIIHYVPGPSLRSLVLTKALKSYCRPARTVVSATQPKISFMGRGMLPVLKPDLVLTQSQDFEETLVSLGYNVTFLPNGVDTERFVPISLESKRELRTRHGVAPDKFVILHVGPIKSGRGLEVLSQIQDEAKDVQVLVVGSTSMTSSKGLVNRLTESGCLVWQHYFEKIEEIYALADCYVFPTTERFASIDMPLSVMEAMSCNVPVISTRFRALGRVFEEGDGFFFSETKDELLGSIHNVRNGVTVKIRDKVLPYSWNKIVSLLEDLYGRLTLERD